jgi:plasmid maintenance system antidote protein VapI
MSLQTRYYQTALDRFRLQKNTFEENGFLLISEILEKTTQKDLATRTGVSEVWINRIVNRHSTCSVEIYKKLLEVHGELCI